MHKFSRDLLIQTHWDFRASRTPVVTPDTSIPRHTPPTPNPRVCGTKASEPPEAHSRRLIPPQGSGSLGTLPHSYKSSGEMGRSQASGRPTCRTPSGARAPSQRIPGSQVHPRRGQSSRYRLRRKGDPAEASLALGRSPGRREDLTSESLWGPYILPLRGRRDQVSLGAGAESCGGNCSADPGYRVFL